MVLLWRLAAPVLSLASFFLSVCANISIDKKVYGYAYNIQPKLRIRGKGFSSIDDHSSIDLTFLPKRSIGTDYTLEIQGDTALVLTLQSGSTWILLEDDSSPQPLFLSAAKVGEESILDEPVQVATVLPTPTVQASKKNVFMGTTPKIMVNGTNFNVKKTDLFFDPPLPEGITMSKVISSTQILLTKTYSDVDKVAWCSEPGPLKLIAINTGGGVLPLSPDLNGVTVAEIEEDLNVYRSMPTMKIHGEGPLPGTKVPDTEAGMVNFPEPVTVAKVVDYIATHESGVTVFPSNELALYQETSTELFIHGSGFKGTPKLTFEPKLPSDVYDLEVVSEDSLKLTLHEGKKWCLVGGVLLLKSIDVGDGEVTLGGTRGITVAVVLNEPNVIEIDRKVYRTLTSSFPIIGSGFVSRLDYSKPPVIILDKIPPSSYDIQPLWTDNILSLRLVGEEWVSMPPRGNTPIKIVSIDTGAGVITFPDGGIQVARVEEDSSTTFCEDSCIYAINGNCEEPRDSTSNSQQEFSSHTNYYHQPSEYSSLGHSDDGSFIGSSTPCEIGTDCTDCPTQMVVEEGSCTNTCSYARDGMCDDPRLGDTCASGTDCQDCGPWGEAGSNFTYSGLYLSATL